MPIGEFNAKKSVKLLQFTKRKTQRLLRVSIENNEHFNFRFHVGIACSSILRGMQTDATPKFRAFSIFVDNQSVVWNNMRHSMILTKPIQFPVHTKQTIELLRRLMTEKNNAIPYTLHAFDAISIGSSSSSFYYFLLLCANDAFEDNTSFSQLSFGPFSIFGPFSLWTNWCYIALSTFKNSNNKK